MSASLSPSPWEPPPVPLLSRIPSDGRKMFASRRRQRPAATPATLTDFLRGRRIGDCPESLAPAADANYLHLSRLLQMDSKKFWESVGSASSLRGFLDSYLRFRKRFFDISAGGYKAVTGGVSTVEEDLASQIRRFLHRIFPDKDSDNDNIDCRDSQLQRAFLLETKWLDLPTLMDISVLFKDESARKLVTNAIISQPNVMDDLAIGLSYFLDIANSFCHLCMESFEVLASFAGLENGKRYRLESELEEIEDVIIDGIVTMDHFITAYKPAALFLSRPSKLRNENDFLNLLARMHGTIVPLYMQKNFCISWCSSSLCEGILSLGRNLLISCYLSDDAFTKSFKGQPINKLFPVMMDDPASRGDIVFQTLVKVNEEELASLVRVPHAEEHVTFLKSMELRCGLLSRIRILCEKGRLFLDDRQFNDLSRMMLPPSIKPRYFDDDDDADALLLESKSQESLTGKEAAL